MLKKRLSATAYIFFSVTVLAVALFLCPVYLLSGILLRLLFGKSCPPWIVTASALLLAVFKVGGLVFYSPEPALGVFEITVSCIFAYVFVWVGFGVVEGLLSRSEESANKSASKTSYWILLAIVTLGSISAFVSWKQPGGQPAPTIDASSVSKVAYTQYAMRGEQGNRPLVVENDENKFEALLDVISEGRSQQDHKCASIAEVEVFYDDPLLGSEVIEILPSHGSGHFDLRFRGGNYKINKTAFLKALDQCGFSIVE